MRFLQIVRFVPDRPRFIRRAALDHLGHSRSYRESQQSCRRTSNAVACLIYTDALVEIPLRQAGGDRHRSDRATLAGVNELVRLFLAAAVLIVLSWAGLAVLARRLPPGVAKDAASVLPACATAVRRLRGDRRVPRRARVAVAIAALWVLSPIDLIPEFLPVIGPLDDILVVALALRYAARQVPWEVLSEAWPAEDRLLERVLGHRPDR